MKQKLTVIKLGGNCMNDPELMHTFLQQFANLTGLKILVHGGGKMATDLGEKLKIPKEMIDGRRVTSADTLEVVTMVYAGSVNKNIVAQLQRSQCNAIGLCGTDGNLITSEKRSAHPIDYGFVGDPVAINLNLLHLLLQEGYTPVIAPITHDGRGQLLNTNADTVASAIARALVPIYEVQLIYAFDKKGVMNDPAAGSDIIARLSVSEYEQMKSEGRIHSGMLPKLKAGFDALQKNVHRVTLQHLTTIGDASVCTQLIE